MTALPAFIDQDAWEGFVEMRRRQEKQSRGKIAWTSRAEKLVLAELYKLRDRGHDPNLSLDQSTLKGWTDVWPVTEKDIPNNKPRECMTSLGPSMTQEQKQAADRARQAAMSKLRRVA